MFLRWVALSAVALATACTPDQPAAPAKSGSEPGAAAPAGAAPPTDPAAKVPPTKTIPTGTQAADRKPCYEIVPAVFDFGMVEPNEVREFEFELFNRSDRPFQIARLATECQCLTIHYDRGPIEPGKSAKIHSKITAVSSGQRATAANLYLTDPERTTVRVPFNYAIVPEVLLEPKKIDFGRTETGKQIEMKLRVSLSLPEVIKDVPKLEPYVTHDLPITMVFDPPNITTTKRGTREWTAMLRVKLLSDKPIPPFSTSLVFDAKDTKAFRTTMLPLTGEVVAAWYFERPVLAFGVVESGSETTKTLRFFWPGETPPTVSKLESDNPAFTATHTVDAAKHCFVVSVKCVAPKAGKIEGAISLLTSLSPDPNVLRVTAHVK